MIDFSKIVLAYFWKICEFILQLCRRKSLQVILVLFKEALRALFTLILIYPSVTISSVVLCVPGQLLSTTTGPLKEKTSGEIGGVNLPSQ